jgi:hypothetical protein
LMDCEGVGRVKGGSESETHHLNFRSTPLVCFSFSRGGRIDSNENTFQTQAVDLPKKSFRLGPISVNVELHEERLVRLCFGGDDLV